MWRQRTFVLNDLLAYPSPTRISRRVIHTGRRGGDNIARTEALPEVGHFRIVVLVRLFHGIEVVEDSVELVEPVYGRQIFVAVAQMIFANLRGRVTFGLKQFRNRRIPILDALFRAWQTYHQETSSKRNLPQDECGSSSRAGLLRVVIGEERAVAGNSIDVRGATAHHATVVSTDIPDADIIGHDDDNVGFLRLGERVWGRRETQNHQSDKNTKHFSLTLHVFFHLPHLAG